MVAGRTRRGGSRPAARGGSLGFATRCRFSSRPPNHGDRLQGFPQYPRAAGFHTVVLDRSRSHQVDDVKLAVSDTLSQASQLLACARADNGRLAPAAVISPFSLGNFDVPPRADTRPPSSTSLHSSGGWLIAVKRVRRQ